MTKKILIIGQGLAGTILALALLENQENEIVIIDNDKVNTSSKVAGGLFNPIVFKRLTQGWKAKELIKKSFEFYNKAEQKLYQKFHFKIPIYKILANENESDFWIKKSKEHELSEFLSNEIVLNYKSEYLNQYAGFGEVKHSGYLDTRLFLSASQSFFKSINILQNEEFSYDLLKIENEKVIYREIEFDKIIFCQGFDNKSNPYFNWLPFKPAKGEVLTLKIPNFNLDKIINKNAFILPLGNDLYKVGATYKWDNLDDETTGDAKDELLKKLNDILIKDYEIINQEAGIRPSVIDRRPILGAHPKFKNVLIFNGLGTKGVLIAPLMAEALENYIHSNTEIDLEMSIERFYKHFN